MDETYATCPTSEGGAITITIHTLLGGAFVLEVDPTMQVRTCVVTIPGASLILSLLSGQVAHLKEMLLQIQVKVFFFVVKKIIIIIEDHFFSLPLLSVHQPPPLPPSLSLYICLFVCLSLQISHCIFISYSLLQFFFTPDFFSCFAHLTYMRVYLCTFLFYPYSA